MAASKPKNVVVEGCFFIRGHLHPFSQRNEGAVKNLVSFSGYIIC